MKGRVRFGFCLIVLILWSVGCLADQQDDRRFDDEVYSDYMTEDGNMDRRGLQPDSNDDHNNNIDNIPSDDQEMDQMDVRDQQDMEPINEQDVLFSDDLQEMSGDHIRTRRGLRKLRKKFGKIRHKINKVIGPRGSSKRKLIESIAAKFLTG